MMPLTYSSARKVFCCLTTCFDEQCCFLGPYQTSPRVFEGVSITVRLNSSQKYGKTEMAETQ